MRFPLIERFWNALPPNARAAVVCASYMACGPVLIVLNSSILHGSDDREAFPYPATVSSVGLVVSSLCVHVAAALGLVEVCDVDGQLAPQVEAATAAYL